MTGSTAPGSAAITAGACAVGAVAPAASRLEEFMWAVAFALLALSVDYARTRLRASQPSQEHAP